jgi:hypothetical protein
MRDSDIERLMEEANALAGRVNFLFQRKDVDVVLAAIGAVLASYLQTLPEGEREAELQDWLRLVRKLAKTGGLQ